MTGWSTGETGRYCPACDARVDAVLCPVHHLATTRPNGADPAAHLQPGQRVGHRYEILRALGRGAMGAVYAANQLSVDRLVALKVMSSDALTEGRESIRRFHQEAQSASRLNHPNIVAVHDFGVDEDLGMPFIAMELLEGQTLAALLRARGPLPLGEAAAIASRMARGLAAAHRLGIVHRDLKPENVIVDAPPGDDLHLKIVDFGIARHMSAPLEPGRDDTGTIVGTPRYLSPEQIRGEPIDGRADLYALGCILFELLEGRPPFEDAVPTQLMMKHLELVPPPLERVGSGPEADVVRSLCRQLLARVPSERPESAVAVGRALQRLELEPGAEHEDWASFDAQPEPGDETLVRDRAGIFSRSGAPGARSAGRPAPPVSDRSTRTSLARPVPWAWIGAGLVATMVAGAMPIHDAVLGVSGSQPEAVAAALGDAGVLACPIWEVRGVEEPSGWLGASAADVLCRRARWYLGGRGGRTSTPAQLLDFAPVPDERADPDPYADPGLRARSESVARTRADAWVRGRIAYDGRDTFTATIRLYADGPVRAGPWTATGRAPFEAAGAALDAAVAAGVLPPRERLEPDVAYWWYLDSVEDGLALQDLYERTLSGLGLTQACARLLDGQTPPPVWERAASWCPSSDRAAEAKRAVRSRVRGSDLRAAIWKTILGFGSADEGGSSNDDADARVRRLRAALTDAGSHEAQNLMRVAIALSLQRRDHPLKLPALRSALERWPRQVFGLRGIYAEAATELASLSVVAGLQAWEPSFTCISGRVPAELLPVFRRRAFLQSGGRHTEHTWVVYGYGRSLLDQGRVNEARAFAASLLEGHPTQSRNAVLLEAEAALTEAEFVAVATTLASLPPSRLDPTAVRHLYRLAELAPALRAAARPAFEAVCDPTFDGNIDGLGPFASAQYRALNVLELAPRVDASLGRRCLAAFDASPLADEPFFADCRLGVERYLGGDVEGAVRAWRRIRPPLHGCRAPVSVIQRVDPGLAARADAVHLEDRTYGGAHPAQVREARRAATRGEYARARVLAERVVRAWGRADVRVPAVDEMRALLRRLPATASANLK